MVRRFLHRFGYQVRRIPAAASVMPSQEPYGYSEVRPLAKYSPWLADEEFRKVYGVIKANTLVDEYRCYELWYLARQMERLPGLFIEVGVWKGGTGCLLAFAARKPVILCDTFRGVVKAGAFDTYYKGGEHSDATEEEVNLLAARLGVSARIRILRGVFPEETGMFVNEPVALCHVDVDVYEGAKDVFDKIWPLLVPGGVVIFDDYGFLGCEGVTRFVNEICADKNLFVHNLNGHAILAKTHPA